MRDYGNKPGRRLFWKVAGVAGGLGLLVGGLGLLVFLGLRIYNMDPAGGSGDHLLACGFKRITGLVCPGCGATRATHFLMHGELERAFAMNPAFVAALPLGLAGFSLWAAMARRGRRMPPVVAYVGWGVLFFGLLGYWLARNQDWWPWPLP